MDTANRKAWWLPLVAGLLFIATAQLNGQGEAKLTAPPNPSAVPPRVINESEYAGSEACANCHQQAHLKFKKTKMGKILLANPRTPLEARGCEACHGPGAAHVQSGGGLEGVIRFGKKSSLSAREQNEQCLQCHEQGMQLFWRASPHESRGVACVTCHKVMEPTVSASRFLEPLTENRQFVKETKLEVCFQCHQMRRAQLMRSSHMPFREGKVTCTSCHNPHGSPNPKQLIESTTNENCYKCHAERRGPFLWEHPPVLENCLNCHEAHGATHPQLLKARTPRLCQRCHIESQHPTIPFAATGALSGFVFNRACTNCHSQIHGSNHPSGVRFHR